MRNVTTLETVSYASVPRYVSRTQNVGDAVTQGLELEAKFRASDVIEGAPRIDVRANTSISQLARSGCARARQPARPTAPTTPPTSAPTTASRACR